MMQEHREEMLRKMNQKQEVLEKVQLQKHEEIKVKHNDNVIKQMDKRDNVERIMRVQEY